MYVSYLDHCINPASPPTQENMVAEFVPEVTPEMAHKLMNPTESAEVIQILAVARLKVIQMNNFLRVC